MSTDERTRQFALGVLRDAGLDGADATIAIEAFIEAGLMVGRPFVVPTFKTLYAEYRRLAEAGLRGRLPLRWVMCRETYAAIARLAGDHRAPIMPELRYALSQSDEVQTADTVTAVRVASEGRLFDIPIRIDPAARAPMWEVPE